MKLKVLKEVDVRYVEISANVRYGEEYMPNGAPKRDGDTWKATLDLEERRVIDWPQGETLSFYMKVCDEGVYRLLDENKDEVASQDGYVPNKLLPGDYGDYLALDIDGEGNITNWLPNANLSNFCEDE